MNEWWSINEWIWCGDIWLWYEWLIEWWINKWMNKYDMIWLIK